MKEVDARQLAAEIIELCRKHGLWLIIKEERKPDLAMIRIEEISIKVDK